MTKEEFDEARADDAMSAYEDWLEKTGEFDTDEHEAAFRGGFDYGMAWGATLMKERSDA